MDQVIYIGGGAPREPGVEALLREHFPGLAPVHLRELREVGRFEPDGAVRGIIAEVGESDALEPLLDLRTVFPASGLVLLGPSDSDSLRRLAARLRADALEPLGGPLADRIARAAGAMNGKAQGARAFSGTLADLTIADIVQLRCLTRKSSLLQVSQGGERGSICFDRGEVVDAQTGSDRGVNAFNRIIAWEHGHFRELPYAPPARATIAAPWEMLLLEALRQMDEARAAARA